MRCHASLPSSPSPCSSKVPIPYRVNRKSLWKILCNLLWIWDLSYGWQVLLLQHLLITTLLCNKFGAWAGFIQWKSTMPGSAPLYQSTCWFTCHHQQPCYFSRSGMKASSLADHTLLSHLRSPVSVWFFSSSPSVLDFPSLCIRSPVSQRFHPVVLLSCYMSYPLPFRVFDAF